MNSRPLAFVLILNLLLLTLGVSAVSGDLSLTRHPYYDPGDSMVWEVNATGRAGMTARELVPDGNFRILNLSASAKTLVLANDSVWTGSKEHQCVVFQDQLILGFQLVVTDENRTLDVNLSYFETSWYNRSRMILVQEISRVSRRLSWEEAGQEFSTEERSRELSLSTDIWSDFYFPLKPGSTWNNSFEGHLDIFHFRQEKNGSWVNETGFATWKRETGYEILGEEVLNITLGEFSCLVRKEQVKGSSAYELGWYDERGIPVRWEAYGQDGALLESRTLENASFFDPGFRPEEDDSRSGFFTIGIILLIVLTITGLIPAIYDLVNRRFGFTFSFIENHVPEGYKYLAGQTAEKQASDDQDSPADEGPGSKQEENQGISPDPESSFEVQKSGSNALAGEEDAVPKPTEAGDKNDGNESS